MAVGEVGGLPGARGGAGGSTLLAREFVLRSRPLLVRHLLTLLASLEDCYAQAQSVASARAAPAAARRTWRRG